LIFKAGDAGFPNRCRVNKPTTFGSGEAQKVFKITISYLSARCRMMQNVTFTLLNIHLEVSGWHVDNCHLKKIVCGKFSPV
jgi:hypothetical protein